VDDATQAITEAQIDPAWWTSTFDQSAAEFEQPEALAHGFESASRQLGIDPLRRQVLEALAIATSAMLDPDNWQEPFKPAMQFDGRRSALPADLTPDQLGLLARIAALITQLPLRARVADAAWVYGDRKRIDLLDLAIDAYRSCPVEREHWFSVGEESWRRAFQLAKRLGKRGAVTTEPMCDSLRDLLLNASTSDGFFAESVSHLLAENCRVPVDIARRLGDRFVQMAAEALPSNPRLSRHFEREANAWLRRAGDVDAAHDCTARIAETFMAAAEATMAADESRALVATLELEQAIATINSLPRSYRKTKGLDVRLVELRAKLDDTREATLEAMVTITGESIDLTQPVAHAEAAVSGKGRFEALSRLAVIAPLLDLDDALAEAEARQDGTLAGLFPRATFTGDRRKVAASSGREHPGYLWTEVVRSFRQRVELATVGLILPAKDRLMDEHHYPVDYLASLCLESPLVPPNRSNLWARGLSHGFNDDFPSAASVLVPQLEQMVRFRLKQFRLNTMVVDEDGVETEKGLGALLVQDGAAELFGGGLVSELRALLVEKEGANLRNEIAHGLFNDLSSLSFSTVYAWWLALRVVVVPLWHARQAHDSSDVD
jgi:hypothetical protein